MNPKKLRSGIASVFLRNYLASEGRRSTNMVVTGFPKSGTTWVSQLCADYFGYHYLRNDVRIHLHHILLHTHSVSFEGRRNLLYVVRDPREAICSAARTVSDQRPGEAFDEEGRVKPSYAMRVMKHFPGATTGMASHLQACIEAGWDFVRFEDLKADTYAAMATYIEQVSGSVDSSRLAEVISKYNFSALKRSTPTDKFLARSSVDSWRSLLPEEVLAQMRAELGDLPARFGYDMG